MEGSVLVGTSNWADHKGYYPPGTKPAERISYYAQHFPVVSVDSTYYTLQPRHNFEVWCERTPDGFQFDVKAHRELTMHDRTPEGEIETPRAETFEKFSYSLEPLRECGKLKAIQFQFPPWFKYSEENMEYIETVQDFLPNDLLSVEFRHRSWLDGDQADRTLEWLRERNLTFVMVDEPQLGSGSVPPVVGVTNPELAIIRFHGRNTAAWYNKSASSGERFKYLYTQEELADWVPAIEDVRKQAREVQVFMNNNYGNYAVRNAVDMMQLLGLEAPRLELPDLPDEQPQLL